MNKEVYGRYERGIREIPVWALIRLFYRVSFYREKVKSNKTVSPPGFPAPHILPKETG